MDRPRERNVLTSWIITPHARFEMTRRGIPDAVVELVLRRPHQRFLVRPCRDVYQRRFVTVYQTSKIEKYWRLET